MRGVGASTGAITIVNALFTGIGCAAAVDLPIRAEVDLRTPATGGSGSLRLARECDTPLARESLLDALRRLGGGREFDAHLVVQSSIPPAKGLKSSSALGLAIGRAVASALGAPTSDEREASASARISRALGLSATGAYDDAFAAAAGGIALTDNRNNTVLARDEFPPDWVAVVWIPHGTHAPSPEWHARFRAASDGAAGALKAAENRQWLAALDQNSTLVEHLLGVDRSAVRRRLSELGALASGTSGLGPAFASVVPRNRLSELTRLHPAAGADLRVAEFVRRGPSSKDAG
ncbi:MAG: shikimate kinase [Thermoplasmata archaeon]|nr:shikimate kinase [Thermoplasmata archaeon]